MIDDLVSQHPALPLQRLPVETPHRLPDPGDEPAARGFTRLSEARLKPLGFGLGHLPVMVALRDGQAATQRDLARFARTEQAPMAQMLDRMERDGLITRTPDPADKRSSRVTLTPLARQRMPDAIATLLEGNHEALRGFSQSETEQLADLLTRLLANLDEMISSGLTARGGRRRNK